MSPRRSCRSPSKSRARYSNARLVRLPLISRQHAGGLVEFVELEEHVGQSQPSFRFFRVRGDTPTQIVPAGGQESTHLCGFSYQVALRVLERHPPFEFLSRPCREQDLRVVWEGGQRIIEILGPGLPSIVDVQLTEGLPQQVTTL